MTPLPRYRFERLVADALDDLPAELHGVLDNVVVVAADRNPDEPTLLGLYETVSRIAGHQIPIATVVLVALLVISGFQSLLFAMWFDMDYNRDRS